MWTRLTIFQKGLLLVAVPAMIQLGLIWLVYRTQQHQVEAQHWSAHTKEVLGQAQRILTLVVEEQTGVRGFLITNNARFVEPFNRAAHELPAALEKLQSLVADNPPQSAKAKQIAEKAASLSSWYAAQAQETQNGELDKALARVNTAQANNQMADLRREINDFMQVEDGLDRQREATLQSIQQRLRRFLIAGTAVAFVGLVGLKFVFYRGISKRLARLSDNAQRLAEGKELTAPIQGHDEIALLDRAFHKSAETIAASKKELQEERDLMNTVVSSMGEGVMVADPSGKFLIFNSAAKQILGTALAGTAPEHWSNDFGIYFPDGQTPYPARDLPLARALRNERVDDVELAVRPSNRQETTWITVSGRPLTSEDGSLRGGVAVFRDVTDRRRAEAAILKLNEGLEHRVEERTAELANTNRELMQKNQENEMFVYSVSHDLRSPLVSLQGFSKELNLVGQELRSLLDATTIPEEIRARADGLITGEMQQSLKFIQTGVLRLSSIIDALLRLSRVGRVEYEFRPLNTNEIVIRVVEAMSAELFEKGVEVRVSDLPPCHGDATAVEQVFANLVGNATKYLAADRKGEIEIGTMPSAAGDSASSTFFVKDNGLGIPAAYYEKIFQAFQRVHPGHAPGDGMGLAIVRRIVQRHGGRAWVESSEGQGSTFFVTLPDRAPAAPKTGRQESGDKQHGHRANGDLVGGRR
jgi:signal transduction histidine kinase/CHASE3 domain sensor protein